MSAPVLSVLNSSTVEADYFAPNDELSNIDKEITFTALQHSSDDEDSTAHEVAVTKDDDISQIIIESETNNDIDAENETLSTDLLKVNELPFTNEDMERSINKQLQSDAQYLNDEQQKLLLRRIVCEVGSALSKRFDAAADFILPEVLDEPSTTELILELKTLIEQLSKENSSTTLPTNAEGSPPVSEWVEVNEWQPTPDYGLESPIIAHLLSNWTNDNAKIDFLRSWVRSLYMPSYEAQNYPPGLQITNLTCVLRDGFMVLLIPLIRSLSKPPLTVHVKKHSRAPIPVHPSTAPETDLFAQDDFLYDIRIKRLDVTLSTGTGSTVSSAGCVSSGLAGVFSQGANAEGYVSDQVAAHNFHQQRAGLKHRGQGVDSQSYYSPLSEINSALPAIEAKTKRSVGLVSTGRRQSFDEPHIISSTAQSNIAAVHQPAAPDPDDLTGKSAAPTGDTVVTATPEATEGSSASKPHTAPTPSILQSIFSWWEPAAPAVSAPSAAVDATTANTADADLSEADEVSEVSVGALPSNASFANASALEGDRVGSACGTATSPTSASPQPSLSSHEVKQDKQKEVSSSSSVDAPAAAATPIILAAVNPVNKIAERLQQMRAQKQLQQGKQPSATQT